MLHKEFGLEVKEVATDGTIEGYGSVFGGAPDSYGDIVHKGAFADSLADHRSKGTMPLMLWGHQASELPIGDWKEIAEDNRGLWLKGQIDLEDPVGARVHRALKRGSVKGLSIGYQALEREPDPKKQGTYHLKKVDLWEVSPVNFPAQRRAKITRVKSLEDGRLPTLSEFEDFLREAGFSKSQATAIAGKGLAPLLRGEPGSTPAADFMSALNAQLRV